MMHPTEMPNDLQIALQAGAPTGWTLPVREVLPSAEFIYPVCGEMRTMPGLSAQPAAERVDLDEQGEIVGLS